MKAETFVANSGEIHPVRCVGLISDFLLLRLKVLERTRCSCNLMSEILRRNRAVQ